MAEDIVERLAQILMLRDCRPFPRVWKGEPREGKEVDNRGVTWTTYTPVCSEKERQKWRGEAAGFIKQLRAMRLELATSAPGSEEGGK